eukprot:TRINITY_DN30537_c0_g1_i1.p1 TRINITY_DN30537_c0_g1~~TRINITY_DN30537_c0_g1_i1.p1  ORF type:complete len:195 (+),score=26.57 TRINITY_DN30537_c0_g1_i1:69-587(+)
MALPSSLSSCSPWRGSRKHHTLIFLYLMITMIMMVEISAQQQSSSERYITTFVGQDEATFGRTYTYAPSDRDVLPDGMGTNAMVATGKLCLRPSTNDVYFVDVCTIRKVNTAGEVTIVAGMRGLCNGYEDGYGTSARLSKNMYQATYDPVNDVMWFIERPSFFAIRSLNFTR